MRWDSIGGSGFLFLSIKLVINDLYVVKFFLYDVRELLVMYKIM